MKQKAFTLIEMVVVISIIMIFTTAIVMNYRGGENTFALLRSTHKLAQDIRIAQEKTMSSEKFHEKVPGGGYGIYFNEFDNSYILFADCDDDGEYNETFPVCPDCSGGSCIENHYFEKIEEFFLEESVIISEITSSTRGLSNFISISFIPPDPIVSITSGIAITPREAIEGSEIITIHLSVGSKEKTVSINSIGTIDID